jgi:membrane protease subunit (stomatin/prohibitin family)
MANKQQQQAAAQQAAAPPEAPAEAPAEDPYAQLEKLGQLHEQGILTDEEFAAQKAKLLG